MNRTIRRSFKSAPGGPPGFSEVSHSCRWATFANVIDPAIGGARSERVGETSLVRKQYHLRPSQTGIDAWDVDRLIEMSRAIAPTTVDLDSIPDVDADYWFFDHPGKPSVRDVVEHARLISEVDTSHPIILDPDGRVMDGMHRVARALLDRKTSISAVKLATLPEPDFRDCRPEDLPY